MVLFAAPYAVMVIQPVCAQLVSIEVLYRRLEAWQRSRRYQRFVVYS